MGVGGDFLAALHQDDVVVGGEACFFQEVVGELDFQGDAFGHVLVGEFPADFVAFAVLDCFGFVQGEVCLVVGAYGAEGGGPQVVFEGALEGALDVCGGDTHTAFVGDAVVQEDQPGAAFDLDFPGVGCAEVADVCGGVQGAQKFCGGGFGGVPNAGGHAQPLGFRIPVVTAMPATVAVDELALVDFGGDFFVVVAVGGGYCGDVYFGAIVCHDFFNLVGKVGDFCFQLVVALVGELQVSIGVVADFVTHLGEFCKACACCREAVAAHVGKEEGDPDVGQFFQNGGEVFDLVVHGVVEGKACCAYVTVPGDGSKRSCCHSVPRQTKGECANSCTKQCF